MGFFRSALGLVAVAASVVGAWCHGMMIEPKARNVVHNSNYCPHCLAAGGPGVTYAGCRKWPNALHGVGGDPHTGPLDHEAGGKFATKVITGRYVQGQVIKIKINIEAPHGGRFSFGVCPVPDGASDAQERAIVTQKCIDANQLTNVEDGTKYWWFGKKPAGTYEMSFRLPPRVSGKRCVLQWHYESGNSCTIPGTPPQHVMSPNMVPCDQTCVMEEFWNVADVRIEPGEPGASGAVSSKPKKKARGRGRGKGKEGFGNYGFDNYGEDSAAAHLDRLDDLLAALTALLALAVAAGLVPLAVGAAGASLGAALGVVALVFWCVSRARPGRAPARPPPAPPGLPAPPLLGTAWRWARRPAFAKKFA
jgi:hypothetical protein